MIIKDLVSVADCFDFRRCIAFGGQGGEPSADGMGSAPPELAKQQAQAGSDAAPATPPPLGAQSTFIPLHRWGGGVKVLLRYFLTRK